MHNGSRTTAMSNNFLATMRFKRSLSHFPVGLVYIDILKLRYENNAHAFFVGKLWAINFHPHTRLMLNIIHVI